MKEQCHDDLESIFQAYDKVMRDNYRNRVNSMPEEDLLNYYRVHNLPNCDRETVFDHMSRWGGINGLIMKEGLKFMDKSGLLKRLSSNRSPLQFPPPRKQGSPWYEIIDDVGPHRCTVDGVIRNRRRNRHTWKDLIIVIENCPWELIDANPRAGSLLDAQTRFQFPSDDTISANSNPIHEAIQIARTANTALGFDVATAEILVHYGQWPNNMRLFSTGVTPLSEPIDWPLQAVSWSLTHQS